MATFAALERSLSEVDINLLVALDALLACKNVTHAARRVGQSQPAMSRLLGRLRDFLGDDILVRSAAGARLTIRGEYLAQLVPVAMSQARGIIGTRGQLEDAKISIDVNLMPALLPHFAKAANLAGCRLKISSHKLAADGATQLRSHIVDYVIGSPLEKFEGILSETMCYEDFVTLVGPKNEHWGCAEPALEQFLAMTHISLVIDQTEIFPEITQAFATHGLQLSKLVKVPDIASAAMMASQTKFALTVPRSSAEWLARMLGLSPLVPAIKFPSRKIMLSWHACHLCERTFIDTLAEATAEAITGKSGQTLSPRKPGGHIEPNQE
ncbi:LysR family transcriptional regulator [Rhizobium leguminosarum]|uniref:LysR family transcriptional regulator n=1 Tax=Rhizobium leguminosarum TaxID=384 RepID=UPI001C93E7B9|nr:LysR family transcriptional regulator [Rhizobium leguminosarum]MBY5774858.1 LysR family transcriptional regulator [Rhizobium leguminosarum]